MDNGSIEKLKSVHPFLSNLVTHLVANLAALGLEFRVGQGLRTFAEQNALYAQGRSKPGMKVTNAIGGQSNHNFGLAVDLCVFTNGQPDWNNTQAFKTMGTEAEKLGLEWGGRWKFTDMPHVQLKGMSVKECLALYNHGGLPSVWQRMDAILSGSQTAQFISTPTVGDLLEFGDKGEEVTKLQNQLVKLNLLHSYEVDGDFGTITKNAVVAFQRMNKLTADGIVGPGTKAKLG